MSNKLLYDPKMKPSQIKPIESLSEDTQKVFDVLNSESDLACVLIGTSFLDENLRTALHRFFIKSNTSKNILKSTGGALGSYSNRCDIAYCLSIISKQQYIDLKIVGDIRNMFAHSHLELTFKDTKVVELTNKLKSIDMLEGTKFWEDSLKPNVNQLLPNSRERFNISLVILGQQIMVTSLGFKNKPRG